MLFSLSGGLSLLLISLAPRSSSPLAGTPAPPPSPLWHAIEAAGKEPDETRRLHKMQDAFSNEMSGREQVVLRKSWDDVVKQHIIAYRRKVERQLTAIRLALSKKPPAASGGSPPAATAGKGR